MATSTNTTRRIAVIGSGISGLGCAWQLGRRGYRVTLFESEARLGGHAHTVDVTLEGHRVGVDTGFLVFNHRTYPNLLRLFSDLKVQTSTSEMSFSVSEGPHQFEWAGTNLRTVFTQKRNLLSPSFMRMLADILRFNRQATMLATQAPPDDAQMSGSLRSFLERHRYSDSFRDRYLLPMAAAIWSSPIGRMLEFPVSGFIHFLHNHGLLQISDRPQWYTVTGGSREYVERIAAELGDVRLSCPVRGIARRPRASGGRIVVTHANGDEAFDDVVLACHSDQSLALLTDAGVTERQMLGGVRYQPNAAWLHTDVTLMPRNRGAWAAWNYLSSGRSQGAGDERLVSVTYWLNRLQPLPFETPVMVSLNPLNPPAAEHVIRQIRYDHPVLDQAAADAVRLLPQVQGVDGTWFAGAWLGYGFHEDGLRSGLDVAEAICARDAARNELAHAA